ncbi:hypothetical protein PIB30_052656 [Stylosanthes scabra]|uniref:Uncharacterized protein n=1 Tax=Stylosanthes scabra TaxID=79078 RepID=A0ABU6ZH00_9FABA|nr:hypothetical protein [Stylosanthes scabra]
MVRHPLLLLHRLHLPYPMFSMGRGYRYIHHLRCWDFSYLIRVALHQNPPASDIPAVDPPPPPPTGRPHRATRPPPCGTRGPIHPRGGRQ